MTAPAFHDLREEIRQRLATIDGPAWHRMYQKAPPPAKKSMLLDWIIRLGDWGLLGLAWPAEHGGRGLDGAAEEVLAREFAAASAPPMIGNVGSYLVGPMLIAHGTALQQERHLQAILDGTDLWCQGFSEPEAGSDLGSMLCRATPDDAGGFVISGTKVWTSFAHVASRCLLLARTGPASERPSRSISCFLVDLTAPGVSVRPITDLLGRNEFNEVHFDRVAVTSQDILGELHGGWALALELLNLERRMPVRGWGPQLNAWLDDLVALAASLPEVSDAQSQAVGEAITSVRIHSSYHEALTVATDEQVAASAGASIAKLAWDDSLRDIREAAQLLLGASAIAHTTDESQKWSDLILDQPSHSIAGGTTEVQLNSIAHGALGIPRGTRR